ncbi:hypothetical protein MASR2M117_09300 [Paludibacter sp.]
MIKNTLKTIAIAASVVVSVSANAQTFQVSTQTFDLDKIDRAKGWEIYSGHLNADDGITVKIGKPVCNSSASNVGVPSGTVVYKFSGLGYEFDELKFDKALNYVDKTTKTFPTTIATLAYEPVHGKKFIAELNSYILKRKLTTEFIGRTVVAPSNAFAGVAAYYLGGRPIGNASNEKLTLTYSQWCVEDAVVDSDGTIYLYGTAGTNNKDYFGLLGAPTSKAGGGVGLQHGGGTSPKEYPNFQLLSCTQDGKLNYITAVDAKAAESVAQVVQGLKTKANKTVIFNTQAYDKDIFFTKDLLIMAGQQLINPVQSDKDNLFVACFEKSTGKLKDYYIKPETNYATQDLIFNKDRSTLYWAAYDLTSLNTINSESGESKFMASKKVKSMLAGYLYLSKIDLASGKASNFELIGENKFALSYKAPVLVGDDNADEIIFQGRTMEKKVKDSELIFISVKK